MAISGIDALSSINSVMSALANQFIQRAPEKPTTSS